MNLKLQKCLNQKGETIYVNTSMVLTSNPPQYNFYHDANGTYFGGYILCSECIFV